MNESGSLNDGVERRSPVRTTERWIKWSTAAAVLCVAAVAAVVSYDHAFALVRSYGEDGWTARLVPLTVDGLIYASSMVMLHCARHQIPVPQLARWLLGLGIAATLAANATHGLGYGVPGALIAAWPAVALVGAYELLMMLIRTGQPEPVSKPAPEDVAAASIEVPDAATEVPASSATDAIVSVVSGDESDPDSLQVQALDAFTVEVTKGRVPSIRTIRSRLRVGQPKAQQVLAYLASVVDGRQEEAA